jgi:formylglycine-generating enzyme required for sulfatase activity
MMDVPRRAMSGLLIVSFLACAAAAQDPAKLTAEIKKAEERLKEETDRVAKKKENLQVEFAALFRPETKAALQAKLGEIGAKYHDQVGASKRGAKPSDSRPSIPDQLKNAIQEECKAALAATVGRNLATVLDAPFAANLISGLKDAGPINYEGLVADTIGLEFAGTDFEANYAKLAPRFEQKRVELEGELMALKQKLADREAADNALKTGIPPGMVAVPAGKYHIGIDAKEYDLARKILHGAPHIDMFMLGWPPHDVELQAFYIDTNEVPCRYWAEFIRDTGRKPPRNWVLPPPVPAAPGTAQPPPSPAPAKLASDPKPSTDPPPGMENLPVTFVTYEEVELYHQWCGRRLPTEFEWEAAARFKPPGDQIRFWPWGDAYDITPGKAQCNNNTAISLPIRQRFTLTPLGSFPQGKSFLGLNDMAGNAAEMTSSFFVPYPGWVQAKCPSQKAGRTQFSGSLYVTRGGTALADELITLTSTRFPLTKNSGELIGFRSAASQARGKDFFDSVVGPGGQLLAAQLESSGPALKDEKSGRPELALGDPGRYSAKIAGGWDAERQVPSRARYLAALGRNTLELTDASRMKTLAHDQKKPLMLAYFRTDVEMKKPALPKGAYWIMWDPGHTKTSGKDKTAVPEGLVFQPLSNRDLLIEVPTVNPVFVAGVTEKTHFDIDKTGTNASLILAFPVKERKDGRFVFDIKLEAAEGELKDFK